MANVSASLSLTTNVTGLRFQPNGDVLLSFELMEGSAVRASKTYRLLADGSGVYDATSGAQVAATTPTAFITAATALKTQADNALAAAAAAGKVTL